MRTMNDSAGFAGDLADVRFVEAGDRRAVTDLRIDFFAVANAMPPC